MTQNDKAEFAELINASFEPTGKKPSAPLLGLFWGLLKKYDIEKFRQAVMAVLADSNIYGTPRPADFIRHIEGTPSDKANKAWSSVYRAVKSVGYRNSVVFGLLDGPAIHAAIQRMGGWEQLCSMLIKDEPFRAREFKQIYEDYLREPPASYPGKLVGQIECHNSQHGVKIDPPIVVGDHDLAVLMLTSQKDDSPIMRLLDDAKNVQ